MICFLSDKLISLRRQCWSPDELPAVTVPVPSRMNAGRSLRKAADVQPARGNSSAFTCMSPVGMATEHLCDRLNSHHSRSRDCIIYLSQSTLDQLFNRSHKHHVTNINIKIRVIINTIFVVRFYIHCYIHWGCGVHTVLYPFCSSQ